MGVDQWHVSVFVLQCKVRLRSCFLQAGGVRGGDLPIEAEGLGEDGGLGFMPPASSAHL